MNPDASPNLYSRTGVRSLLSEYGVEPTRGRGQNFLIDRNTVDKLVDLAELAAADLVLDLGTGFGVMAGAAALHVERVIAVDIDERLLAAAREAHAGQADIQWMSGDLRRLDLLELVPTDHAGPVKVLGNLPYSVSKLVLRKLLESMGPLACAVVTVQREVGERMTAPPGGKDYGPLSVACSLLADATRHGTIPPTCFHPRPRVESTIVRLLPPAEDCLEGEEAERVFRLVRAAFAQRRKTLVNSVAGASDLGSVGQLQEALQALGVRVQARAETLAPQDFVRLSRILRR